MTCGSDEEAGQNVSCTKLNCGTRCAAAGVLFSWCTAMTEGYVPSLSNIGVREALHGHYRRSRVQGKSSDFCDPLTSDPVTSDIARLSDSL